MASTLRASAQGRQVFVKMTPAPRTLAQSRSVLKSLQKFGEVSSFLNTKYFKIRTPTSGNSAFAIFASPQAATDAIRASPLTVPLSDRKISNSSGSLAQHDYSGSADLDEQPSSPDASDHAIQCYISEANYDHKGNMRKNPYNMGFQISRHWMEVQDLMRTPDSTLPLAEYADCFVKRKFSMPYRIQDRYFDETVKAGGTSLMNMWRQGMEMKEKEEIGGHDIGQSKQNSGSV
ncbi:hypothetical protein FQN49_002555 [Arthroderma sp. PD_2]|nr:hypothetical protein FQN49_002555 [Arthroderma sp. PD_2]